MSFESEILSIDPDYIDELQINETIIGILTLSADRKNIHGFVEIDLGRPITKQDIDIIKGFYAQGKASLQRVASGIIKMTKQLSTPFVVSGPGE